MTEPLTLIEQTELRQLIRQAREVASYMATNPDGEITNPLKFTAHLRRLAELAEKAAGLAPIEGFGL